MSCTQEDCRTVREGGSGKKKNLFLLRASVIGRKRVKKDAIDVRKLSVLNLHRKGGGSI